MAIVEVTRGREYWEQAAACVLALVLVVACELAMVNKSATMDSEELCCK